MKIETAARNGDVATLQELDSNGVDVTGVVSDQVSGTATLHMQPCILQYIVTYIYTS